MKTALRALIATVILVLLTGVLYPAVMTAFAQVALKNDANGSLVQHDGTEVGSSRIGQAWSGPRWFYGRPSAVDDDASTSSGSNLGPTSKPLSEDIASRIQRDPEAGRAVHGWPHRRGDPGRPGHGIGERSRPGHLRRRCRVPGASDRGRPQHPAPAGAAADRRRHGGEDAGLPRRTARERARTQPRARRGRSIVVITTVGIPTKRRTVVVLGRSARGATLPSVAEVRDTDPGARDRLAADGHATRRARSG